MLNGYRKRQFVAVLVGFAIAIWALPARPAEQAKNVILMVADGAGFNAWHVASYYQHGQLGKQPYDQFPVHYGCTTYMLNYADAQGVPTHAEGGKIPAGASAALPQGYDANQAWRNFNYSKGGDDYMAFTDSAAAATATYTGVKTTRGRIAMSWEGKTKLTTVAELADASGRATGAISSVQVSHATPAAVWAHHRSRNNYAAIFREMLHTSRLDVIMGAGHPLYSDNATLRVTSSRCSRSSDDNIDYKYVGGQQTWNDLTDGNGAAGFQFIQQQSEFEKLAVDSGGDGAALPRRVVGIAQVRTTLQAKRAGRGMAPGVPLNSRVPTLQTMTRAALSVLSQNPNGFFLMVEGGAVDWANHENNLERMIEEMIDFNRSVRAVVDWVEANSGWDETLLIVTSDHECGMLWGESTYLDRNDNGHYDAGIDTFQEWKPIQNRGKGQLPGCQYGSGGHTNALVPLWAIGAGSERFDILADAVDSKAGRIWGFSGKFVDNTDVFRVMKTAMGLTSRGEVGRKAAADRGTRLRAVVPQ